jgi:hypothetical protein
VPKIVAENSGGKLRRKIAAENCCGKLLRKIAAENSCRKLLRKVAAENLGGYTEFMGLVKFRRTMELWRTLKSQRLVKI